jgi:hypothetical protein
MAWTDYFVKNISGSKVVASADAKPLVSIEIAPKEYVEIELNIEDGSLPFHVFLRRFDALGGELENRLFAQVGDRELAKKSALDLSNKRLNSIELVLDGE